MSNSNRSHGRLKLKRHNGCNTLTKTRRTFSETILPKIIKIDSRTSKLQQEKVVTFLNHSVFSILSQVASIDGLLTVLIAFHSVKDRIARTAYVDAVYCYRRSSVVCQLVCRSVCRSVCHTSEQKRLNRSRYRLSYGLKLAQEIMCQMRSRSSWEGAILGKGAHIVKYRNTLRSPVRKQLNRS